jgi:predicted Zn-dependent peptidase
VSDMFAQALWSKHPLGEPIAGSIESVTPLSIQDLVAHRERSLSPEIPMLVVAAGNVDHDRLVACAAKGLEAKAYTAESMQKCPKVGSRSTPRMVVQKDVTQVNVILSRRASGAHSPDRHALGLVNLVLGGGMASRLNQEIREKRGLAYSVYSFSDYLLGAGALGVSLGTEPAQAAKAIELVAKEIDKIRQNGLSKRDLKFAKDYASGSAVLALESPSARMQNLGKCQLLYGRPLELDDILTTIEQVTPDQVDRAIEEHLPELSTANGWTLAAVVPQGFKDRLLL